MRLRPTRYRAGRLRSDYAGPRLGATVKGSYKRHWILRIRSARRAEFPRRSTSCGGPPRNQPDAGQPYPPESAVQPDEDRHDLWKKRYPDSREVHGIPWTGIENATPEVKALAKPRLDLDKLPFDPLEYIKHLDQLPFDPDMDVGFGD